MHHQLRLLTTDLVACYLFQLYGCISNIDSSSSIFRGYSSRSSFIISVVSPIDIFRLHSLHVPVASGI
jgi:hypothetical protein